MESENKESKSNGMELLENVIKSNKENIEQSVKVQFDIEDLTSLLNEIQIGLKDIHLMRDEVSAFFKLEQAKRDEFLASIPTKTEIVLSQDTIDFFENYYKKMKAKEKFNWSGLVIFILGIFTFILSITFATKWYKESIKAKSELRQEMLNEIADEGKRIYNEKEIKILTENTQIMQIWIKNNPKKAEDFLQFKDGFEAKNHE